MSESGLRFEFGFARRYRPWLLALGVHPGNSEVLLSDEELSVRFGRWWLDSPLDNVDCIQVTGPYRGYRAIGIRGSFVDHGITFGTNTHRGVCVEFKEAVPALLPGAFLKHPGMTVTVADVDGFVAALQERAGLD